MLNAKTYTSRIVTFLAILNLVSGYGFILLFDFFSLREMTNIRFIIYVLFLILFSHVAYGTTVSIFGFWKEWIGGDKYRISKTLEGTEISLSDVSVAIVMPIYGEDPVHVFSRIEVMYNSLIQEKEQKSFDFFILSDTRELEKWVQEESAYIDLCNKISGFGRIFYRRRKINLNRKSGNIADFCRRWGKRYRYMIVLDADSLMTGECFIKLTRLMEINQGVGIIQTNPKVISAKTIFQKISQFNSYVHGNLFAAGANFWQLNSSAFWGHNAIIRMKPFLDHCGLPSLPKFGAIGGRILSHDTIEAAFIRRAGYSVWFAYDLDGSYEESPPNPIDSLKRDQRWAQGNLQHFWFLFSKDLKFTSRVQIFLGIFSYLSSLFWLFFLIGMFFLYLEDIRFFRLALSPEQWKYFWNYIYFEKAIKLQIFTYSILFLPRILSIILSFQNKTYLKYSKGFFPFIFSYFIEFLSSFIYAPILMYMHSKFILVTLMGKKIEWTVQNRSSDNIPNFKEIVKVFSIHTILGIAVGIYSYFYTRTLFYWMIPIWLSWVLSPLFVYIVSKIRKIENLFFLESSFHKIKIVEELETSIQEKKNKDLEDVVFNSDILFLIAIDPYYNSLHASFQRNKITTKDINNAREKIIDKFLKNGPSALNKKELQGLYYDSRLLQKLYTRFWNEYPGGFHRWWIENFIEYQKSQLEKQIRKDIFPPL